MKKSNNSGKKKVTFSFQTEQGKEVFIVGTFNDWQPEKTKFKDNGAGEYTVVLHLPAGMSISLLLTMFGTWTPKIRKQSQTTVVP